MIDIKNKDKIQKIKKPWGSELWIANGENTPYALKKLILIKIINLVYSFMNISLKPYFYLKERLIYISIKIK